MGPEHDRSMSPEALSTLFQQRPIRPLPKRRLRERLSPDVADSIEYPPATQQASPLFLYPSIVREEPSPSPGRNYTVIRDQCYEDPGATGVDAGESDEEESKRFANNKIVRRSQPEILTRTSTSSKPGQSKQNPQPPPSTASSIDGYDSFENTNNKKKRKIPSAGDSGLNGIHSLNDINSLSISAATSPSNDHDLAGATLVSQHGSAGFVGNNHGISGPGRGRFGRARNGRSPLRTLSDATNSLSGRGAKPRPPQWAEHPSEHSGIISSAIANAEKLSAGTGQENISLLHQAPATAKPRPASSQFTFTCDSQVPGTQWPGSDPASSLPSYIANRPRHSIMTTSGTGELTASRTAPTEAAAGGDGAQRSARKKKADRRRLEKELKQAAADRRREALRKLRTNPPKPEDFWICEFCEYERIFGEPPWALIQQYEMKDLKARRQEEERKRLLEKAKAKSRKAKKGSKAPGKHASSPNATHTHDDIHTDCHAQSNTTDEEDEEYLDGIERGDDGSYSHDDPPMVLSDDPDAEHEDITQNHHHPPGCACVDLHPAPALHTGGALVPASSA